MKFVSFVSRSPTASVVAAPGAAEVALDARETAEICGIEINILWLMKSSETSWKAWESLQLNPVQSTLYILYYNTYIYICIHTYHHISQSISEVFAASGGVASASSGQDPGSWKSVANELLYACASKRNRIMSHESHVQMMPQNVVL